MLGFYGPDSRMWRINREAVLLGAGPAATLLQVAHPLIAEGVAQHSDFQGRPVRTSAAHAGHDHGPRVRRRADRERRAPPAQRRPRLGAGTRDHARRRPLSTGVDAYRALDPELLLWVQVTLIVTSVRAYARWVGPLARADLEAFWSEARSVGVGMGIPLRVSPADWPALMSYWHRMLAPDGPIQVTDTARLLAPMLVRPPLPLTPGWAVDLLALPGLALLPDRIRDAYGIPWGIGRARAATLLGRGVRLWTAVVPVTWRSMPQARAADRRVRGG